LDADAQKPLGDLAADFRKALRAESSTWAHKDRPRMYGALNSLDVLWLLNDINKRAGKHLSGGEITWEEVVNVHARFYWALRAFLDVANSPPATAMH
jgi:hypothetical protein